MSKVVDARGLDCPAPVIETKKAIEAGGGEPLTVIVDNPAAVENLTRFARSIGAEVKTESAGDSETKLLITPGSSANIRQEVGAECRPASEIAVFIASDMIGSGDDDLGRFLMQAFIRTLLEVSPRPTSIAFMNAGVKLAVADSAVVEELKMFADAGVNMLVCGKCLDHFGLSEKLSAGRVSNMFEIASLLCAADRVIRP